MATRITFRATVSLESDTQPVQTHRMEIQAATAQKAASRAVQAARKAFPGSRPRSIVVVLEEMARCVLQLSTRDESARALPVGVS